MFRSRKLILLLILFTHLMLHAQLQPLSIPNAGGNKKASISENIGLCEVKVLYHRPGVKGREGRIWGTDVAHYGMKDLIFGSSRSSPWRVGANDCTVIQFSTVAQIEGQELPAGTYGLFMELGEIENIIIFNKNTTAWGSFSYNPNDDILRVKVRHEVLSTSVEWMKFDFENQTEDGATLSLSWEKRKIPIKIKVNVVKTQFENFKKELETPKGLSAAAYVQAANFCLQHTYEMEQGLKWAERAVAPGFPGERSFITLNTLANYYFKNAKKIEAEKLMKEAIQLGTQTQVNGYARSLIAKNPKEAYEIYKNNFDKNPNTFTALFGMVRGNWAIGDKVKAIEFAKKAIEISTTPNQKTILEQIIKDIEAGKAAN
jgi:hypothetical protein